MKSIEYKFPITYWDNLISIKKFTRGQFIFCYYNEYTHPQDHRHQAHLLPIFLVNVSLYIFYCFINI